MQKNFFTVGEIADILEKSAPDIENLYQSGQIDPASTLLLPEGIRLIPAWQLPEIKKAMKARAGK